MRLILPAPLVGIAVAIEPDRPLPSDREAWYRQVVGAAEVLERAETESGWPVVMIAAGARLHAFFELFDRGVAVALTAASEADLDTRGAALREWLLAGDIDRRQREICCLAQIWEAD